MQLKEWEFEIEWISCLTDEFTHIIARNPTNITIKLTGTCVNKVQRKTYDEHVADMVHFNGQDQNSSDLFACWK